MAKIFPPKHDFNATINFLFNSGEPSGVQQPSTDFQEQPQINGFVQDTTGVDDFVNKASDENFLSDAEKEEISVPRDVGDGSVTADSRPSSGSLGQSEKREPSASSNDKTEEKDEEESATPTLKGGEM